MTVKSLRKQLAAAIAMTLVATVALGSSTYAWFVTNNTVEATTSTISAQSNAAFMVIRYGGSAIDSDDTEDVATLADTKLYPTQWANNFDSTYQFETAFALAVDAAAIDLDSLSAVGSPDAAKVVQDDQAAYVVENIFNVSSKGTDLADLKVDGVSISSDGNDELDGALRVLVTCGENWVLCNKDGIVSSSHATAGYLSESVPAGDDTTVKMYVFYDGNDENIYTNNLPSLQDASNKITVTLTADPDNH